VTDAYRRPIYYNKENSYTLKDGIIAAKNKQVYDICAQRIEENTGISMELNHQLIATEAFEIKKRKKLEIQL
jgi:hypothetical protein